MEKRNKQNKKRIELVNTVSNRQRKMHRISHITRIVIVNLDSILFFTYIFGCVCVYVCLHRSAFI